MVAHFFMYFVTFLLTTGQESGAIRLYNHGYSSTLTSGIVEVFYNQKWNTICRFNSVGVQNWGWYEADVSCQQLGYTGASAYSYSYISE